MKNIKQIEALRNGLTSEQWDTIRDALEMRVKECLALEREFSTPKGVDFNVNTVNTRLALTFKNTADKANALIKELEDCEIL